MTNRGCLDETVSDMDDPQAPSAPIPHLSLREDRDVAWHPVSGDLTKVRSIVAAITLAPPVLAGAVLAVVLSPWFWLLVVAAAALWGWYQWFVVRQVRAISYAELDDELAIRRGRMWRRMVTIPYGRIQYVDVEAGPLMRAFGLAEIEVHTASPSSSGEIPGLPAEIAETMRERLTALGESRRAGL